MKKILLLNYEFPPLGGGASPVSYEIAKLLSQTDKYSIDVVTMRYKELPSYEKINDNLRIHRIKCWRSKKEICYPWEQLTYLVSAYFKCKKLLKKNKYNICHTHFIIPTGILALKLKNKFSLNYIITSHGSDVIGYNPRFKNFYPFLVKKWKKIIDESDKIITPSEFLKKEILKVYPSSDTNKIKVIYNGIEKEKFIPLPKRKIILLVIRLFKNKGIQDFIEAIKNIDLGNWKVNIVGDGPYKKNLENLVERYKLSEKIKFLGWLDNKSKELKEIYGRSTIFVLPSRFENMNITLLEAMQAGCSVIASNAGGNTEVVNDAGITYQVGDKVDFRAKLVKLLNDFELRNRIARKSTQRIQENFEWGVIINQYTKWLNLVNQ
ncbi:MAG: hypothetical protein COT24_03270 [Candidatus Kerfeldbacteria bacterium CG08_land_8_20_14_0_20_40_16]|uniref:Glycosyltransferase family 4 protein n=1 Tax=Candidatus Kerfeldbacteria bacterium CG08_land_8_20_14_0_20_40_16 TaxID=2014244 RepID=A0A2H0YVH9_9BACT|nr:MAG: hypothetical protein COT24_03270 [Candidatus Kerfeldbacteria bacterium CG08_land_8_20_14_0_20_40_16]